MNKITASALTGVSLKSTPLPSSPATIFQSVVAENDAENDDKTRDYFFQAGLDEWYNSLEKFTFKSSVVELTRDEAKIIVQHWQNLLATPSLEESPPIHVPTELCPLIAKVDNSMKDDFNDQTDFFVKLSTRSPKDSKTVFRKAVSNFLARQEVEKGNIQWLDENYRWIVLTEEVTKASSVCSGSEAIGIFLDSERVAEDLQFALEDTDNWNVSVVIRVWNPLVTLQSEFRGFCWNRQLNCLGQYFHPLYFPELIHLKEQIANDCLSLFDKIKDSLPVPNAMVDFAWLGVNNVLLIEVNPLSEELGSFPASTGLFDWENDKSIIQASEGNSKFEIRVRNGPESSYNLKLKSRPEWRRLVYEGK